MQTKINHEKSIALAPYIAIKIKEIKNKDQIK
jgi:hypothetical protein